ncbi:MAG: ribonuclease HI [Halanaerobiaceae bacterium]
MFINDNQIEITSLSGIKEYINMVDESKQLSILDERTREMLFLLSIILEGEEKEVRPSVISCSRQGVTREQLQAVVSIALSVGGAAILPRVKKAVYAIESTGGDDEVKEVDVYTDGACAGNPGPGGYAAVIVKNGNVLEEISGFCSKTTNNRMELMALIEALKVLGNRKKICVYTDSDYLLKGVKSWLDRWNRNGWKTSSGNDVKNKELWQNLKQLLSRFDLNIKKVKAHSGDKFNEIADSLAKEQIEENS